MKLLEYYHQQERQGLIVSDEEQLMVLQHLQHLHDRLLHEYNARHRFLALLRKPRTVKGLYIWGGVGIGKTFLMDCFYHCMPIEAKQRMHFHQFMRMIHQQLKQHQGKKDPIRIIAKEIASNTMLLCFDELFVSDITDAMLLGRLFKMLFKEGVCLVATSNVQPDDLYRRGLQRELFLPAIALLKEHTDIVHVQTQIDYRLTRLKKAGVFYTPNDALAHQNMETTFAVLTQGDDISHHPLEICGRQIQIKKMTDSVVWFDFNKICHVPRSQQDYLAIAEKFKTIFISDVPIIAPDAKNTISLFIRMIDVFYDARKRLVLSAETNVNNIYTQGDFLFEYARTQSRLLEMQSEDYISSLALRDQIENEQR